MGWLDQIYNVWTNVSSTVKAIANISSVLSRLSSLETKVRELETENQQLRLKIESLKNVPAEEKTEPKKEAEYGAEWEQIVIYGSYAEKGQEDSEGDFEAVVNFNRSMRYGREIEELLLNPKALSFSRIASLCGIDLDRYVLVHKKDGKITKGVVDRILTPTGYFIENNIDGRIDYQDNEEIYDVLVRGGA